MWEESWEPVFHKTLPPREAWDKQDETAAWEKGFHKWPRMDRIDLNKILYRAGCRHGLQWFGALSPLVTHWIFSTKLI